MGPVIDEAKEVEVAPADNYDVCRFCWSSEDSVDNPKCVACSCQGSIGYLHFDCLKSWIKTKMSIRENESMISMFWKQFECEICKTRYPYVFKANNREYHIVDMKEIPKETPYMILESLDHDKNSSRIIHTIMLGGEKHNFKMGRGHDSDLRVNDISVSRCHAIIKYIDSKYYLEDNLSKFGTLVLLREKIEIEQNATKAV